MKKGGVEPEGWLPMDAPQSVTVTATGTRRMVGYLMNGTLIETDERTYTFPVSQWTGETAIFAVIYATNLYVNAVSGSDLNDGFTPEQAKKTLNGILAEALPGDVVHAAEGVYNENCHAHDENIWNSAGAHVLPAVGIGGARSYSVADLVRAVRRVAETDEAFAVHATGTPETAKDGTWAIPAREGVRFVSMDTGAPFRSSRTVTKSSATRRLPSGDRL